MADYSCGFRFGISETGSGNMDKGSRNKRCIAILIAIFSGSCFGDLGDLDIIGDLVLSGDEKKIYWYNGDYYLTLRASSSLAANYNFLLPVNDGDNNQYLKTDGSGILSWSTPSGAGDMLKSIYDTDEDGDIDQVAGGTELDTSGVTNGQLIIGNSTGNVWALGNLTGTSNRITVTNGAGSITLSAPQDINTGASPTFSGLNLDTLTLLEQSSNPAEPADGKSVIWMSDGTGYGDTGDVMIATNSGGIAKYGTLFDYSAGSNWITDALLLDDGTSFLLLDDGTSKLLIRP